MTAVVVLGDFPSTGHTTGEPALRMPPWHDATAELVSLTETVTGAGRAVLALYPSWQPERARRMVRAARSTLGTDGLAGVAVTLPPLALSFAADFLAYAAPYAMPGVVAGLARRLERELLSGAWLATVTGLKHQPVGFRQHVASHAPGSRFLALASPAPAVYPAMPANRLRDLKLGPAGPVHVLTTAAPPAPGAPAKAMPPGRTWTTEALLPALEPSITRGVAPQPLARSYWGTGKCAEFVAFSGRADLLRHLVDGARYEHCSWCRRVITGLPCPFCAMSARYAEAYVRIPARPAPAAQRGDGGAAMSSDGSAANGRAIHAERRTNDARAPEAIHLARPITDSGGVR